MESPGLIDIEALQRQAATLETRAQAVETAYNRATWIRFVMVFFPVPFVVVLFRLYLEPWHYYVAGALFIAIAGAMVTVDGLAAAKRDAAIRAAESARQACEQAQAARRPP